MSVVLRIYMQKCIINYAIILKYNSNRHLVFYKNQFKEKQTWCSDLFKPKFVLDVHSGHISPVLFNYLCDLEGDYFQSSAM